MFYSAEVDIQDDTVLTAWPLSLLSNTTPRSLTESVSTSSMLKQKLVLISFAGLHI